jgi:sarcosine oxidase subunit gamma
VDYSDRLAVIEVRGTAARALLSKGCGLDLSDRAFPARYCARTRFAQLAVILECLDDSRFELTVARSYSS